MGKVLVVCLNPTFQKTYMFKSFILSQVNRELYHREDASGKGINVARVLTQKNIDNSILTHLHIKDESRMLSLVNRDNINIKYVLDNKSRVRTCSTILTKSGETTELVEESNGVDDTTDLKIRELFNKEIESCEYLIITGTRSPNYSDNIYSDFVKIARNRGVKVLLDVAKSELIRCIEYKPNIIKPNLSEFMKTFYGEDVLENTDSLDCKDKVISKIKELYKKYNIVSIISRGINPTWVYDQSGFYEVEVIKSNKLINTIGCGDTLSASLVASLIEGKSIKDSLISAMVDAKLNAESEIPGSLI